VEQEYDLIVIGDQLSGLFLAAGAAQRGQKVLVLEESSATSVFFEAPSGRLLGDFMVEPVVGLVGGSPVDVFLRSLGLYQELDQLFPLHDPALQILGPDFRLDFPYDAQKIPDAVRRELPFAGPGLSKLTRMLAGETVSKRSFRQVVEDSELPVGFEGLGLLQAALYGSISPNSIPYPDYCQLLKHCSSGVRYAIGGRDALKQRLLGRIQTFGGKIRRATRVEQIVFERRRLGGVLLSSYEGFVRSKRVAGALAARTFFELLPPEMRSKRLEEEVNRIRPVAWRLAFTLLVPEAVIPEGMGSHLVLWDGELPFSGDGFIQLQAFQKDIYGGIPARHVAIAGRVLQPLDHGSLGKQAISRLLKQVLLRIEELMPFLKGCPFQISPDPERLEKDPVFQHYFQCEDPAELSSALLVYDETSSGFEPGSFLNWAKFGLEGLALCSRDIRPQIGLFGEIQSAMDLLAIWKQEQRA
jgi:hypothetical protein